MPQQLHDQRRRYEGMLISSWPDQEGNKLQRPNSWFIQLTLHEVQYNYLARCSNFCKLLKNNSECCPSNQVSAAAMTSTSEKKWRHFNCFSVQETDGSPPGSDPENRVGDQDVGGPDRPISCGLRVPGEPGHCRARTRPPWWTSRPAAFFLQNILQLHQQRWLKLRVDWLEDNQWRGCRLDPK